MSFWKLPKSKPIVFKDKDHKIAWLEYQVDRLKWQLVLAYREELDLFLHCYLEKKESADRQTAELSEKIIALRRKLRSGELDNKQYQKLITPLKKEKKHIAATMDRFVYQALDKPFPEHNITVDEIACYLEETREWKQKRNKFF